MTKPVRKQCDKSDENDDDCGEKDVAIADVRKFMGGNAFQFRLVQSLQHTPRENDDAVLGIAPCRERVERRVIDHIDFRHRKTSGDAEVFHDVIELARIFARDRLCVAHGKHDLITPPIGTDAHRDRHDHGNIQNGAALHRLRKNIADANHNDEKKRHVNPRQPRVSVIGSIESHNC